MGRRQESSHPPHTPPPKGLPATGQDWGPRGRCAQGAPLAPRRLLVPSSSKQRRPPRRRRLLNDKRHTPTVLSFPGGIRCFLFISALLGEGKGKNKKAAERKEEADSRRGHISANAGELRRRCQGRGLGSKGGEQIKRTLSPGRGRVGGSWRREEGGMQPGPPRFACPGCKEPPPFPKVQPLLSHFEQDSPVV